MESSHVKQVADETSHRCALVTGSSNGIGEAIVLELSRADFKLVVTGRDEDDIRRVASECERLSPSKMRPIEIKADLEFEEDVARLFSRSLDHFQGRLDLLVNNAGFTSPIAQNNIQQNTSACYSNFKRTIQVNLNSACHLALLAAGPLSETARKFYPIEGGATNIVNISSIAGQRPLDDFAYSTSKCALSMLSNCLSAQLGPKIRVNSINPGPIETKIIERSGYSMKQFKALVEQTTPLGRIGQPREVASVVLFLIDSHLAGFISGSQINIDGASTWAQIKLN